MRRARLDRCSSRRGVRRTRHDRPPRPPSARSRTCRLWRDAWSWCRRGHGRAALALDLLRPRVGGQGPGDHEPPVPGMHHGVGVPVKHDRRQRRGWPVARGTLLHGKKPRRRIMRRSRREPGMHAHRREQIGIGRGGNDCRRAAGGQSRNVDARRVGRMRSCPVAWCSWRAPARAPAWAGPISPPLLAGR